MSEKHWEVIVVVYGVAMPEILCGLLIAQGVPAITSREGYAKARGLYYGRGGEAEILVPSDYVKQARKVLKLYYSGAFDAASESDNSE